MNYLKNLLKQPIRRTLVFLAIFLAAMAISSLAYMVLKNYFPRDYTYYNKPGYHLLIARMLVTDLILISRIALELTFLLLVAQIVYRFLKKKPIAHQP